ncbi:MAG TPA: DUF6166 domain-containing protein [Chloroflexia bacterium]|nr:DUF6166 domain-containing protein [Chloroflexia bacterium]
MNRVFVGTGSTGPPGYGVHVEVDGKRYDLQQRTSSGYADFRWDGGGPHSTDLARSLLWQATGVEPELGIYRLFKNEVVATWPLCTGECWRISDQEILGWLAGVERDTARNEDQGQTEARLAQSRRRENRLAGFARTFGGQR